jgi:hypothetical protein
MRSRAYGVCPLAQAGHEDAVSERRRNRAEILSEPQARFGERLVGERAALPVGRRDREAIPHGGAASFV